MSVDDVRAAMRDAIAAGEPTDPLADCGASARSPEYSDDRLALRFTEQFRHYLRYVAAWGRWLIWDGTRWHSDLTMEAKDLARRVCREASDEVLALGMSAKVATDVASAKTAASVERLAQADRHHAATADLWDRLPLVVNTPTCTVDLVDGTRPHSREDFLTRITAVGPAPDNQDCPLWRSFLDHVTKGDQDLIAYLQRVIGYCLTGKTDEHALFFLYGTGANGKSVFLRTIAAILGDYAKTAPVDMFMTTNADRHPTELADLRGARLVIAIETEEGRKWAEAKIKALTGGDPIKARFMRQDHFEFTPEFKLVFAGNHKPGLRGVDEAIRRRFHLIPFTVTIPKEDRDPNLFEKLKSEWPAILSWAIEGAKEWLALGLAPPEAVRRATDNYLSEEDSFGRWIEECCDRDVGAWESSAALFASWKAWAEKTGEFAGSQKRFSQTLMNRDFSEKRQAGTGARGFLGLRLVRADYTNDPWLGERAARL